MTDTKQLELFRVVVKQPEQPPDPEFERVCAKARAESAEMLAIANELFDGGWQKLQEVPIPQLRPVRSEFNRRHGLPPPFWDVEGEEAARRIVTPSASRFYKPWTQERKVANRLRLLHQRIEKKWTLIDLKQDALFEAVLDNSQYFGVCPLPGSIESSRITLPNFAKEAAIAYEIQLRQIASGELQPVNIPLKIESKELELETLPNIAGLGNQSRATLL